MRKISLLMAFVALFATVSFANNGEFKKSTLKIENKALFKLATKNTSLQSLLDGFTCTVSASWVRKGKVNSTTVTLNCGTCTSQRSACDAAYALARLAIPN